MLGDNDCLSNFVTQLSIDSYLHCGDYFWCFISPWTLTLGTLFMNSVYEHAFLLRFVEMARSLNKELWYD